MDLSALRAKLQSIGQQQVLRFYDELPPASQQKLIGQLNALDLDLIARLVEGYVRNKPPVHVPHDIKPIDAYPRTADAARAKLYADAKQRGEELLRAGKVAAFVVAGGQGTRLGYEGPKGEYPVTPIKNKPLFQVLDRKSVV